MTFLQARLALMGLASVSFAADAVKPEIERGFTETVRPFVATYCVACHSGPTAAAQFDLRKYTSVADAARDHSRWALVAEKLTAVEMPPKGMKQPPPEERQQVIDWVHAMRSEEAAKSAGDPGLVLVRRLSNAEYNYSIRDLTGVDIRPTREFPVDPSNPAGFDNSGESLSMSPALLNKYLQAARQVASHLVLKPAGFDFAPYPMLAESDREKYTIQRIVQFYDRQPTDYAAYFFAAWRYKHRAADGKPDATLEDFARDAKVSARYLPLVWAFLEESTEDVGPVARLRTMWRMLPGPENGQTELVHEACAKMRDYVVKIRKLTAKQFRSPRVQGLAGTSQPLMNWKLRLYAANRLTFDPTALQVEGEPPMELPVMPKSRGVPTEDEVAIRNAALAARARFGDPDLLVPAGQRPRYEASFAHFASVFPDAFYIRERGRYYPDDSEDKGRLLSAGFHNVMGYFRDDTPLMDLILDDAGRKELDRLWLEFDTIADFTTRTYIQFYFNQSGEIEGRGRESGSVRPSDADVTSEKTIFGIRDEYLSKAETGVERVKNYQNQEEGPPNSVEAPSDPVAKDAIREHFARVNAQIRKVEKARLDAEPSHLEALLRFASRAYRRPLTQAERDDVLTYYRSLREKSALSHDDAMREMIVLALMSPDFCYRLDLVEPGARKLEPVPVSRKKTRRVLPVAAKAPVEKTRPLSDYALASRLSYFLWASLPDEELLSHAAAGDLHQPEVLVAQARRMLKDKRSVSLATEFAGNWLGFRRFESINSVDRGRFPAFTNELREAMFEEPVRFIDDAIRNDRSMLDLLYGKHTFVNKVLAEHYGMQDVRFKGSEWVRVDDATPFGRGGVLPMAAFLTQNSPGLRTSPVKRGYWVAKQLLGEVIPPPPPTVPELPADESKMERPLREMLAKHRENPACAGCHSRFDGFGLAFEGYGPVGDQRKKDLAGRPVDARAEFPGGGQGTGVAGLAEFIRTHRENDYVNNLCRKILAYALGRGLQLSDEPLLEQARAAFAAGGHHFSTLIESIIVSPQFLQQQNPEFMARKGD